MGLSVRIGWLGLGLQLAMLTGCYGVSDPALLKAPPPEISLGADWQLLYSHLLHPPPPLRLSHQDWEALHSEGRQPACEAGDLSFEVHVSERGTVTALKLRPNEVSCYVGGRRIKAPPDPPPFIQAHLAEAESLIRQSVFRPFTEAGRNARAMVNLEVPFAPPERYGLSRSWPSRVEVSSVTMKMVRQGCGGPCPVYEVSVRGDGQVTYEGYRYVAAVGERTFKINGRVASKLVAQFDRSNFLSSLPLYYGADDGGDTLVTLTINGESHTVEDKLGLEVGLPTSILELERAIDEAAGTEALIGEPPQADEKFLSQYQYVPH